jgi:hypothetical protein
MNDGSICHMDPWAIRDWSYFSTVTLLGKDNTFPNDMLHEKMVCALPWIKEHRALIQG